MSKGFGEKNGNYSNKFNSIIYNRLLEKAFLAHKNKNIKEAESIYEKLFKLNIKNQILYFNYGLILESKKNIDQAINVYLKAINLFPKDPNFYNKLALLKKNLGKNEEAENLFLNSIYLDSGFEFGYVNLGNLYSSLGKKNKAEEIYRKVLEINSNSALVNLNLGMLLMDKGEFKEAQKLLLKTIEINPKSTNAFFQLSKFKSIYHTQSFKKDLFNEKLLANQNDLAKVNIYFARANIYHIQKNYSKSKDNLILANSIKLKYIKSDADKRIHFPNFIYEKYAKKVKDLDSHVEKKNYIFIVGMPRSGSTLIESIISLNKDVFDLGESEALPFSYNIWIKNKEKSSLFDLYKKEIKVNSISNQNITDKNLSNYGYIPIILEKIKGSKIIHSYRNPLDNVLSIYRSNFTGGFAYSSSLIDTARVLINQQKLMRNYKKLFPNQIYSINYDYLVTDPKVEIWNLIKWLNFEWDEKYLFPHLNLRKVSTTSQVQVRSPINTKSLLGWKNYEDLLKPVINFFEKENFQY